MLTDADYCNLSAFSCGVEELDKFFHTEIKECVKYHYLSAYCAYLDSGEIISAFTIMHDALMIEGFTEKENFIEDLIHETDPVTVDFLAKQSSYPAINIGHLGVKVNYQKKGIGTAILDFVSATYSNYRQAGCQFLTVDALSNNDVFEFYLKNLFNFQTIRDINSATRRMYKIL